MVTGRRIFGVCLYAALGGPRYGQPPLQSASISYFRSSVASRRNARGVSAPDRPAPSSNASAPHGVRRAGRTTHGG